MTSDIPRFADGRFAPRRKEVIEAQMRRLEAELTRLTKYGDDLFPDGTVLKFKYRFKPSASNSSPQFVYGQWYTYAAIKIKGGWYMTGVRSGRLSWDQFVEFLSRGDVKKLRMASSWDRVDG